MIIYPAIDIKDGKVVRLLQGKFDQVTEYSQTPVDVAQHWKDEGAQWLHVVDLDGARTGEVVNMDLIHQIAREVSISVQMGGGVRQLEDIQRLLEGGVSRVILGTKVVQDLAFLKEALSKWGEQIAVSLDCSNGFIATMGWTHTSELKVIDFIKEIDAMGVKNIIYTDIAQDGMLSGPNYTAINELLSCTNIPVILSGGVATIDDVRKIKRMSENSVKGIIIGKALYEKKLDLKEALAIARL
ncbi:MAG: 1-(5-phosphoribosyl)-5-[(5-phosphoribosylamino)methylideneamino]imidazole-4-carboxamide isomerase [Candidatus Omnitrophica bacterium]|nr:1-(5-phosphoribosyl)-5-[(5-phosphoribosylamino)methylideneamino]imidazole-4-carboxamide isomerase [Candidatus Omnitrophota bacterium]